MISQRLAKANYTTKRAQQISAGPIERLIFKLPLHQIDEWSINSGVWFLSRYSRLHVKYSVEILHRRTEPSLKLGQFHYYTDSVGVPVAFCNWAWLNASVLDDVLATGRDLKEDEFRCGDLPFFYELLAPFGHCRAVVRELRALPFFKDRCIPAIRGERSESPPQRPRVSYFHF